MRYFGRDLIQRLMGRVRAWVADWRARRSIIPHFQLSLAPALHRDVTPNGVRFYCLCACCGARLDASATLCEECAQKTRSVRPQ